MALAVAERGTIVREDDADTVVPWWSFTKTALATAVLTLVRDGRLALDAQLRGRPYALRQLLQHRAGLAEYGALAAYHEAVARGDAAWPAVVLLEKTDADRLRTKPGENFAYSNIGYLLVRRLIEETTGDALDVALRQRVLDPLGIPGVRLLHGRAHGIVGIRDGYDAGWVYHGLLAGPLRSAVLLLHRLRHGDLLPRDLLAQMSAGLAVSGTGPARPWTQPAYGLGLMCGDSSHGRVAGHTGGGPDSIIAIYDGARSAGTFALGNDVGPVETAAIEAATGRA